ncbi:MAG: carbohydrate ABC transporter permease [Mycoplasmatales bacterium]
MKEFKKEQRKKRIKKFLTTTFLYLAIILIAITLVFPFIWTVMASLKTQQENISVVFKLLPEGMPWDWRWENYASAIDVMNFWESTLNTMIIVIPKIFGDVIVSAFVAYGFSRFNFPGKQIWFLILLATLMIPFEITMIPMYIIYSKIGWINTFYPLIIPSLFGASQFIFFLTMYFISMPKDLISAARVDGLNDFNIFKKIYLPIAKPALVVVAIWSFQGTWNDLLGPLIWLTDASKFTLQLSLASLSTSTTYQIEQGIILAATVLVMIPVFIVFLVFQKHILDSDKSSGIKG